MLVTCRLLNVSFDMLLDILLTKQPGRAQEEMMKTTIKLSGGYHGSNPTRVYLGYSRATVRKKIESGELHELLTESQISRLERHFCGIPGCTCGSWRRANIDVLSYTSTITITNREGGCHFADLYDTAFNACGFDTPAMWGESYKVKGNKVSFAGNSIVVNDIYTFNYDGYINYTAHEEVQK